MKSLPQHDVDLVADFLKGKRREKFLTSVAVLNTSIADGGWVKRGRDKAGAGFCALATGKRRGYLDMLYPYGHELNRAGFNLMMLVEHGSMPHPQTLSNAQFNVILEDEHTREQLAKAQVPEAVLRAYFRLGEARCAATKALDEARPKPVITAIGLSPKVTKTLKECNIDIDISTVRMPDIERFPLLDKNGKQVREDGVPQWFHKVMWSDNALFNASRFSYNSCGCEACGKTIPSGQFVPVEADCNITKRPIALWLGRDCARNIFGVKDVGVEKGARS
jgi:hypothetical protein